MPPVEPLVATHLQSRRSTTGRAALLGRSRGARPVCTAGLACLLFTVSLGCVDVEGGAVEVSWKLRQADGDVATCLQGADAARVSRVGLCVRDCDTVDAQGACTGETVCPWETWPCDRVQGNTAFDIPPGRKELLLTALCADDTRGAVQVPAPILRVIERGKVTQLNLLLITVTSANGLACP